MASGTVASAGHGVWKETGDRKFVLTYVNLTFDSFAMGNGQAEQDGNSYTGSGDYFYYDTNGKVICGSIGTFNIKATRIRLEEPAKN